jgi:hypothetical protein
MRKGGKKMKRKIVGIGVCMLMIATALPAVGTINKDIEKNKTLFFPPGVDWMKTYGGEEFNWLFDINITDDGYIAGGLLEIQNRMCAWMLKTDKNGVEEWSVYNDLWHGTSPLNYDISVYRVLPVIDGFIAGGYGLYNETSDAIMGYLWKVNTAGETQWLKGLGNATENWAICPMSMEQVGDELICGGWMWQETPPPNGNLNVALFKTDLEGNLNLSWIHQYDAGGFDWARSLCCTTDGGYFLAGSSEEPNPSVANGAYYMVKTDTNGNKEWEKIFDGPGQDYGGTRGCRQTPDGGYIMCGHSDSWGAGDQDVWIVKTDASGNIVRNITYGGKYNDHCYGMDAVKGGYVFVVVKNAWNPTEPKENLWIIETDEELKQTWDFEVHEEGTQWLQTIHQIEDKGFIVAGRNGLITSTDCSGIIWEISPFPQIDIQVSGGLGVKATFNNEGYGNADDVLWRITVQGGFFGMVNKTAVGMIDILAGESQTVSTGLFFGFGPITITGKVGVVENISSGFVLGPIVIVFGVK